MLGLALILMAKRLSWKPSVYYIISTLVVYCATSFLIIAMLKRYFDFRINRFLSILGFLFSSAAVFFGFKKVTLRSLDAIHAHLWDTLTRTIMLEEGYEVYFGVIVMVSLISFVVSAVFKPPQETSTRSVNAALIAIGVFLATFACQDISLGATLSLTFVLISFYIEDGGSPHASVFNQNDHVNLQEGGQPIAGHLVYTLRGDILRSPGIIKRQLERSLPEEINQSFHKLISSEDAILPLTHYRAISDTFDQIVCHQDCCSLGSK